jgi:NNP family nitrate/nitrite transporter-like MFS transporter
LASSYLAWLAFLLVSAGSYGWLARRLLLPASVPRCHGQRGAPRGRKAGQELFPRDSAGGVVLTSAEDTPYLGRHLLYLISFGGFLALTARFPTY